MEFDSNRITLQSFDDRYCITATEESSVCLIFYQLQSIDSIYKLLSKSIPIVHDYKMATITV